MFSMQRAQGSILALKRVGAELVEHNLSPVSLERSICPSLIFPAGWVLEAGVPAKGRMGVCTAQSDISHPSWSQDHSARTAKDI